MTSYTTKMTTDEIKSAIRVLMVTIETCYSRTQPDYQESVNRIYKSIDPLQDELERRTGCRYDY